MRYIILILIAQVIFSLANLWQKMILSHHPFNWRLLINPSFLLANCLPLIAIVLFLYSLAHYDLFKAATTLGVAAIVFSSFLGIVVLREQASLMNLSGLALAVAAIVLINWK
ncbi:MAG: hypothetical protein V1821_00865 [bacterium]